MAKLAHHYLLKTQRHKLNYQPIRCLAGVRLKSSDPLYILNLGLRNSATDINIGESTIDPTIK